MDERKFRAWVKAHTPSPEERRKSWKKFRDEFIGNKSFPMPQRPGAVPKCADLYVVKDGCEYILDDILYDSDSLHCAIHYNGLLPQRNYLPRPQLILKKIRDIADPDNPGWIELELSGKNSAGQELKETLLWHDRSVKHRAGILDAIEKMTLELAFPSE